MSTLESSSRSAAPAQADGSAGTGSAPPSADGSIGGSRRTGRAVTPADFQSFALFEHIDPGHFAHLVHGTDELQVDTNRLVVREGDLADSFYLVRRGAVAVFRDAVGMPVQLLARLQAGDFFGELGLFRDGAYSASVRATEPTILLRIAASAFRPFVTRHPEVQLQLQTTAARRHTQTIASVLELGRRREVRIRYGREVEMQLDDDTRTRVVLENLSLGGLCLSRAPASWSHGAVVRFGVCLREGVLDLEGEVVWRTDDTVGVRFVKKSPSHDMILQMAIRLVVESAS